MSEIEDLMQRAHKGDTNSQKALLDLYLNKKAQFKDKKHLLYIFLLLAEKGGEPKLSKAIGLLYLDPAAGDNIERALRWFEEYIKSDGANDAKIHDMLGGLYIQKDKPYYDFARGVKHFTVAAKMGWTPAQLTLGLFHSSNAYGMRDAERAYHYMSTAAKSNDPSAQYWVGYMHEYGEHVKASLSDALKFYKLAANAGHSDAQKRLFQHYLSTGQYQDAFTLLYSRTRDYAWHIDFLEKSVVAEKNLSSQYKAALDAFEKQASKGDSLAQFFAAAFYNKGLVGEVDLERGFKLNSMAAQKGLRIAQRALGDAYIAGRGVTKNNEKALHWYAKAAFQGDKISQSRLLDLYSTGVMGVTKNITKAYQWHTILTEDTDTVYRDNMSRSEEIRAAAFVDLHITPLPPEEKAAILAKGEKALMIYRKKNRTFWGLLKKKHPL